MDSQVFKRTAVDFSFSFWMFMEHVNSPPRRRALSLQLTGCLCRARRRVSLPKEGGQPGLTYSYVFLLVGSRVVSNHGTGPAVCTNTCVCFINRSVASALPPPLERRGIKY